MPSPPEDAPIGTSARTSDLTVAAAARRLGVHPNTVRAWTDQGRLRCLRINERGDRRYRAEDLDGFLRTAGPRQAGRQAPVEATAEASHVPTSFIPPADPVVDGRLALLAELSRLCASTGDPDAALRAVAATLRRGAGFETVAITELTPSGMQTRVVDASARRRSSGFELDARLAGVCLRDGRPIAVPRTGRSGGASGRWRPYTASSAVEIYVPVSTSRRAWGVLVVESPPERPLDRDDLDLLRAVGSQLAMAMGWGRIESRLRERRAQARALAEMTTALSSDTELPGAMAGLVEHALRLFGADRAALYRLVNGHLQVTCSQGLSERFTGAVRRADGRSIDWHAVETKRAQWATDYGADERGDGLREVILAEGIDSVAVAPLLTGGVVLGAFALYHDRRHEWDPDDLQLLEAIGAQAGVALSNAGNYEQMATWARQLQSIQQLGTRLTRLTTVSDIGQAIATELKQLIDYHNVRVYRVHDQEVVPVAWRGEIGEYTDENDDQLRLKVGEGITGWVALHGQAEYLPDAATDPRAQTIVGTEDDLAESMLLAPMLYEDRVIGVIVLSKLGLEQFTGSDSLRLLEIYASLAAQAMVNADAAEQLRAQSARLERQVASQQELMRATESILSTLDPRAVMESIADRLGTLVHVDNLIISVHDPDQRRLDPIFARGISAEHFAAACLSDGEGVAGWVLHHGEAQSVPDKLSDPRVSHHDVRGPQAGALIVAPLRARDRVTGLLTLERLGPDAAFTEEEFELIKLFSGHVSIALQNARAHRAVQIRAQTDALTGLKNHGTFVDHLDMATEQGTPFSLLLVDLDEFKSFNDRCGHEAGNQLLTGIATALRSSSRDTDEVFRYGGDEFALVLPGADAAGALAVAEKVRRAVGSVRMPGSRRRSGVTCSTGLAAFPEDGRDRVSLLVAADRACYLAKRHGRNGVATAAMAAAAELAGGGEAVLLRGLLPDQPMAETLVA